MMLFLTGMRLGQIYPIPRGKKRRFLPLLSREKLVTKNESAKEMRCEPVLGIQDESYFPFLGSNGRAYKRPNFIFIVYKT